jgi:hypothetical protein
MPPRNSLRRSLIPHHSTMPKLTRPWLFLLVGATACVRPPVSSTPVPSLAQVDRATGTASASSTALRAALSRGDADALGRVLATDVELVTIARDTVRGRESVARYLVELGDDAGRPILVYVGAFGACRDGSVQEYGASFTITPVGNRTSQSLAQGSILYEWSVAESEASVVRMDIAEGPTPNRQPTCALADQTALRRPLTASLALDMGRLMPSEAMASIATAMDERGFGSLDWPESDVKPIGLTASLRYRFLPILSTETELTIRGREHADGYAHWTSSHIAASSLPVAATQYVQLQWGRVRVGAGPSYLWHNFKVADTHEAYDGNYQRWIRASDRRFESRGAAGAMGAAFQAAVSWPVRRMGMLEVRAGIARYGKVDTPATPNFESLRVRRTLRTLALAYAVGW